MTTLDPQDTLAPFFWLHIKKSGGSSIRQFLKPHYLELDRQKNCPSFIQTQRGYWNDILNNSRTNLADYQIKRTLFAKKYLYAEEWESLYSFAFSREPVSRAVSMFYYLFFKNPGFTLASFEERLRKSKIHKRILGNTSAMFDVFLEIVEDIHLGGKETERHFYTHTAPMHSDISDENGNILLKQVYRLEHLDEAMADIYKQSGLKARDFSEQNNIRVNENKDKGSFTPSKSQIKILEKIYAEDFTIYENAQ